MKRYGVGIAVIVAAVFAAGAGALLVTEWVADPYGTDSLREWIEIYNSGPVAISLDGYKVGDAESPGAEGMYSFPTGTVMAAGQVYVICQTATGFGHADMYPGQKPDFEITETDGTVPNMIKYTAWSSGDLAISNTSDQVLILGPTDQVVDGSNHGNSTFFPNTTPLPAYASYERSPANVDTNTAGDWVVRPRAESNPGTVYIPEPSALAGLGLLAVLFARRRGA